MKPGLDVITTEKIHPITGKMKKCQVFLGYFGKGQDAYRFEGEKVVYSQEELDALTPPPSG